MAAGTQYDSTLSHDKFESKTESPAVDVAVVPVASDLPSGTLMFVVALINGKSEAASQYNAQVKDHIG